MRATIKFQVPYGKADPQRYLQADGTIGVVPADFTLNRSPTGLDRLKVEREIHKMLGNGDEGKGHREAADLKIAIRTQSRVVREEILGDLGLDPETDEEKKAADEAVRKAWPDHESTDKTMLDDLQDQYSDLETMARWAVLAVDVPPFFQRLDTAALDEPALLALRMAWFQASEDSVSGKGLPSGA